MDHVDLLRSGLILLLIFLFFFLVKNGKVDCYRFIIGYNLKAQCFLSINLTVSDI